MRLGIIFFKATNLEYVVPGLLQGSWELFCKAAESFKDEKYLQYLEATARDIYWIENHPKVQNRSEYGAYFSGWNELFLLKLDLTAPLAGNCLEHTLARSQGDVQQSLITWTPHVPYVGVLTLSISPAFATKLNATMASIISIDGRSKDDKWFFSLKRNHTLPHWAIEYKNC